VITWRRGTGPSAVTLRGALTDLLLVIYRRKVVPGPGIDVLGDHTLLDFWLGHVAFG
jgi:hypothetical protein